MLVWTEITPVKGFLNTVTFTSLPDETETDVDYFSFGSNVFPISGSVYKSVGHLSMEVEWKPEWRQSPFTRGQNLRPKRLHI